MSGFFEGVLTPVGTGAGGVVGFLAGGGGGLVASAPTAGGAAVVTVPAGAYMGGAVGAGAGYAAGKGTGAWIDETGPGQYVNQKVEDFQEWLYGDQAAEEQALPVQCSGECPKKERKDEDGNDIIPEDRKKHILDGDKSGGGHRAGTGKPGKTEFPPEWSDDEILDGIGDVAENGTVIGPAHRPGEVVKGGNINGVDIEVVVKPNGGVRTGYPTGGPGVVRNPRP